MVDVIEARWIRNHVIWLKFEDGVAGDVDLSSELHGPVFEPLKDIDYFKSFILNPDLGTLCWPNGADFAPEFLHEQVRVTA